MDLLNFQKPGRYIAKEWNLSFNTPKKDDYRICLCFGETYEVGMSNLGFRIIYQYINSIPGFSCERCFLPAEDLELYLRKNKQRLSSLETKTPLNEFGTVAFSISCELNLINFLKMLRLAGIKIKSKDRNKAPLILLGGLNNPEPVTDFGDIFFLGEAEEKLTDLLEKIKNTESLPKKERLLSLAQLKGVYIPEFYSFKEDKIIKSEDKAKFPLERVFVKDLNKSFYPSKWITPYIPIVFDRLQIEVQRGCPHHCNFCQARNLYFPYREKDISTVIDQTLSLYKNTGYETISFTGLSVMSYSRIERLLKEVIPYFKKKRVTLAVPSIRPNKGAARLIKMLNYAKRPTLTIALETGTEQLRQCAGKHIKIEDCLELVKISAHLGYKKLKFYFMIGLPQETIEDVLAIGETLENISNTYKKEITRKPEITATVSCFIPKPFSEFENHSFLTKEDFLTKTSLLKRRIAKHKNIKLNFSYFEKSSLEGLLSRANRKLNPVIEEILNLHIDKGINPFNITEWEKVCEKHKINIDSVIRSNETLPEHIAIERQKIG